MHFLPGVLVNGFIVVVNMVDFVKQRQMAPLDLLLSCLAISRITLHMLIFLVYLVLHCFKKDMLHPHFPISFLIAVTQFLTGIFTNGFIVVVNVVDFMKQRRMAPLDLLLSCLATTRFCLQLFIFLSDKNVISFMNPSHQGRHHSPSSVLLAEDEDFQVGVLDDSGIYIICIYQCWHPDKYAYSNTQTFLVDFSSKNTTQAKGIDIVHLSVYILDLTVPLIVFLIAVLLLILSLGRHAQHMRTVATGTQDPCKGAYIRALLSILSFLILYFSHYMMAILFLFQIVKFGGFLFDFCTLMAGIYPCMHSVILILGNAKLKQAAKNFLLCGRGGQ
nr:taste receptor type 2 member 1-like [Cavia porcellus]